jgi:hypothetical protein
MIVQHILAERGPNYGTFAQNAEYMQKLKKVYRHAYSNDTTYAYMEATDMIIHKVVRIINGNPMYLDSWVDIVGYSTLVFGDKSPMILSTAIERPLINNIVISHPNWCSLDITLRKHIEEILYHLLDGNFRFVASEAEAAINYIKEQ